MVVAFDYDGTITADFEGWMQVISLLRSRNHTCIVVTNRHIGTPIEGTWRLPIPIPYANGRPKRHVAREAGFEVDVWIDDQPLLVEGGEPAV